MAAAVGLEPPVPGLVSVSRNATAAGPAGSAAGTRALILLSCLLLLVWSHTEKKRVPGGLHSASGSTRFFSWVNSRRKHTLVPQVPGSVWASARS